MNQTDHGTGDGFAQDNPNEWVECPACHSVMTPLRGHEVRSSSEFPAVEAELWEFLLWGWVIFVINFIVGLLGYGGRKRKLATLKRDVLPRFPHSLICPRCFHIQRRL